LNSEDNQNYAHCAQRFDSILNLMEQFSIHVIGVVVLLLVDDDDDDDDDAADDGNLLSSSIRF
jgi:hypothetical protein